MAEADSGHDTVSLTTKLGTLALGGKDALAMFLFIAILALAGLTVYEHIQRSNEHDSISCQIKLNLYMQQQDPTKPMNWRSMPSDLYLCIPKFIYERDQAAR